MRTSIRDRLTRFIEVLRVALFDRIAELRGIRFLHYYDADVVLQMVLGFELDSHGSTVAERYTSDEVRVVRALLSCGFLGTVHMLRPHALELDRRLRIHPTFTSKASQKAFADRARRYLHDKGIEAVMLRLQAATDQASVALDEAVDLFLSILRENAGPTFAAIECVNGTWLQRLRRYHTSGLLSFAEIGPDMRDLTSARFHTNEIHHILGQHAQRPLLANFYDSAALAGLVHLIECRDAGEEVPVVRFYTETNALHQAWSRSSRLRSLLSYKVSTLKGEEPPRSAQFVARDAAYYLTRVRFESLSPSGNESTDSLVKLLAELEYITSLKDADVAHALTAVHWDGQNLLDMIVELEELSLLRSIWTRERLPFGFIDHLCDWSGVFAFAQGSTGEHLFDQIEDVQRVLGERLTKIRAWSENFYMLLGASRSVRSVVAARLEDPVRDLGLVRWGYVLREAEKEELSALVGRVIEDSEEDLIYSCASLATRMEEARSDMSECSFMCAVLWALGRFGDIVDLINSCEDVEPPLLPSLVVMRAAARLKAGFVRSGLERSSLVDTVRRLVVDTPAKARAEILLGVGYVLYHAWKQELIGRGVAMEELPADVSAWATLSLEIGEEAIEVLDPSDLAWAFAVNHCAYVGIVTGGDPSRVERHLGILTRLQGMPALWNSRFEDTLGCYYLVKLEQEVEKIPSSPRAVALMREMAELAKEHFKRALLRDFGDIDLNEHRMRLELVQERLDRITEDTLEEGERQERS